MGVAAFARTLDQEVLALERGVSLECLVCGEFLLREGRVLGCPECGCSFVGEIAKPAQLHLELQAG